MPNRFSAAFFDMGETLYTYAGLPLSWKDSFPEAWEGALQSMGIKPAPERLVLLCSHMSRFNTRENPREEEFDAAYIFSGALRCIDVDGNRWDEAADSFFNYFRQTLLPYDETLSVLRELRGRSVYLGALTDVAYGMPDRFVADDLLQTGLSELLDSWKTSVHVGVRKPSPKGLLELCVEAGLEPDECIYIGNERKDVECANGAGFVSVLIDRSGQADPGWGQDLTINSLKRCLELF